MQKMKAHWIFPPLVNRKFANIELMTQGAVLVYYFTRFIALIDSQGKIVWHDQNYPVYLIEYLLTIPSVEDVKRN